MREQWESAAPLTRMENCEIVAPRVRIRPFVASLVLEGEWIAGAVLEVVELEDSVWRCDMDQHQQRMKGVSVES